MVVTFLWRKVGLSNSWVKWILLKSKLMVKNLEVKYQFLLGIKAVVEMAAIPFDLINWDQTGIEYIRVSEWTMENNHKMLAFHLISTKMAYHFYIQPLVQWRYNGGLYQQNHFSLFTGENGCFKAPPQYQRRQILSFVLESMSITITAITMLLLNTT